MSSSIRSFSRASSRELRLPLVVTALLCAGGLSACIDEDLGAYLVDVNEVHYQGGGTADVLFVVDNSGSMGEEQAALGRGFEDFIESFLALDTDFHLGVTNMDYQGNAGALLGEEKILTPATENLVQTFISNSRVGTSGSGTEKGMESARQALGPAKRENENEGFFREEAQLVLIFVSDEDDQSTATNEEYFDYFLELKRGDRRRLSINAIAGPTPDGCPTAEAGSRYKDIVEMSGGTFTNICNDDLGMPELGRVLSGYKTAFDLQGRPEEGSVTVSVDGERVSEGEDTWTIDDAGRIAFAPGAVPDDCVEVQISYQTRDRVSATNEPFVFESEAPVCARPNTDLLDVRRSSCAEVAPSTSLAGLAALLLVFGFGRRLRRRRG